MARNFRELRAKMSPQSRARAAVRSREMMAEMFLSELRRLSGLTQNELAAALGIKQPTLSRLESQEDMQISTLQRLVKALGGELEIVAKMPGGRITLSQFKNDETLQPA
jgi:transcriptional regulator with XRE-family HTH domain